MKKKLSLYLQVIHKGIVTYISILSARKCTVKLNADRDIYGRNHIEKFWNQFAHHCLLVSFILCCRTDCRMATETYLMFSTTNKSFIHFRQLFVGFISIDIDECVGGSHSCSPDAYCNNTKGSYNCTCKPGFTGSGRECAGMCYF